MKSIPNLPSAVRTSLDLADLDDIDLIRDIEQCFGLEFATEELQTLQTVGDLVALLKTRDMDRRQHRAPCEEALTFYLLRSAFTPMLPRNEIKPALPMSRIRQLWGNRKVKELEEQLGLILPKQMRLWTTITLWLVYTGTTAIGMFFFGKLGFLLGIAVWMVAFFVARKFANCTFSGKTLKDFIIRTAHMNHGRLVTLGARNDESIMRKHLTQSIVEITGLEPERFNDNTRFYPLPKRKSAT